MGLVLLWNRLIDLSNKDITGKHAENILGKAGIALNKNMVPFDRRSPFVTSGIRVGTPALTTRGMGETEMRKVVQWIDSAISDPDNDQLLTSIRSDVEALCSNFPIYEH